LPEVLVALTARQREIARLIASGKSTREIAETLSLSPRTVDTHVQAIFGKLAIHTRVELTALVIRSAGSGPRPSTAHAASASLIGREDDVAKIADLLAAHRAVTIVGTGGVGKTQTALRILESARASFADETWFFDLGALPSGAYVAGAIAQLLGFSLSEGDALGSIVRQLKSRRALFVFDNCEHVLESVGEIVSQIITTCEGISILATSREALRVSVERSYRLAPLPLPFAVDLFVERARAPDVRFAMTDATNRAIQEICRRLDGIALAIELAAARTDRFTPAELLARIDDHVEVLRSTSDDAPSRHRNMQALIDWSYATLTDAERALLRALGIFVGPFSLEGALAVGGLEGVDENDLVQRLASLIDKSLVMVDRAGGGMRYRLLESTRVYARQKVVEVGEYDAIAARHVRFLGDRFAALMLRGDGFTPAESYAALAADLGDVRAALDDAYARGDYESGAALLGAIATSWTALGLDREGIDRLAAYADALSGRLAAYALLPPLVALLFKNSRVAEATQRAQDALRGARDLGDPQAIATSLQLVASTVQPRDVIEALLAQSDRVGHRTPDMEIWYAVRRAWLDTTAREFDRADARLRELMARATRVGDRAFVVNLWMRRSVNEYFRGDLAAAVSYAREAEQVARTFGKVTALAYQLYVLANFLCLAGDAAAARPAITEALEIAASIDPHSNEIAVYAEGAAFVSALEGDVARAAHLSGFARAVYARTGAVLSGVRADLRARVEELLLDAIGESALAEMRARGGALRAPDAIELALA
jgi:predicted ATPase/DNA-binding CsgD family transcriptional regulator